MTSCSNEFCNKAKPFLAVIFLQFGYAGLSIITKFALNQGMSQHVLVVYRHAVATILIAPFAFVFDRKVRPKMTLSILIKILLLGLLEPTIDQNLYYTGMKYTTATFTAAMTNVLPAFAFVMAWISRLEKVDIRKVHSMAKILGTIVTVGGAMLMTSVEGPKLNLPWTHGYSAQEAAPAAPGNGMLKGALMIAVGCSSWAAFIILQAITLKSYPCELSLTALICLAGTVEGTVVAAVMERGNPSAWSIHLDAKLLAYVYSGVVCSGIAYYVQGVVMKSRGPVFVTAFNPLSMVIVAILSSIVLSEIMYLGRIIGSVVIVIGLYLVLWGKSKDGTPSSSDSDSDRDLKVAPNDSEMLATFDDHYQKSDSTTNQDFIAIDVNGGNHTTTSESVLNRK